MKFVSAWPPGPCAARTDRRFDLVNAAKDRGRWHRCHVRLSHRRRHWHRPEPVKPPFTALTTTTFRRRRHRAIFADSIVFAGGAFCAGGKHGRVRLWASSYRAETADSHFAYGAAVAMFAVTAACDVLCDISTDRRPVEGAIHPGMVADRQRELITDDAPLNPHARATARRFNVALVANGRSIRRSAGRRRPPVVAVLSVRSATVGVAICCGHCRTRRAPTRWRRCVFHAVRAFAPRHQPDDSGCICRGRSTAAVAGDPGMLLRAGNSSADYRFVCVWRDVAAFELISRRRDSSPAGRSSRRRHRKSLRMWHRTACGDRQLAIPPPASGACASKQAETG